MYSTVGVFSTVGAYHEYRRDILSTVGVFSTVGDILKFEYRGGDIMIHVGRYYEYRGGCSVPWGTQITKDFPPHSTEYHPWYSR